MKLPRLLPILLLMTFKSALTALTGPTTNVASAREKWTRPKRKQKQRNCSILILNRSVRSRSNCHCKERHSLALAPGASVHRTAFPGTALAKTVILCKPLSDSPPASLCQEYNYQSVSSGLLADQPLLQSPGSKNRRHPDSLPYMRPGQ